MPIFQFKVIAGTRALVPPVSADFEDVRHVLAQAEAMCKAIEKSGICDDAKEPVRLIITAILDRSSPDFEIDVHGAVNKDVPSSHSALRAETP